MVVLSTRSGDRPEPGHIWLSYDDEAEHRTGSHGDQRYFSRDDGECDPSAVRSDS